jgi:hypothetical protein
MLKRNRPYANEAQMSMSTAEKYARRARNSDSLEDVAYNIACGIDELVQAIRDLEDLAALADAMRVEYSRLGQGEEPRGASGHAAGRRGLGSIMVVKQRQETSKSVTMGHIRSHGFGLTASASASSRARPRA